MSVKSDQCQQPKPATTFILSCFQTATLKKNGNQNRKYKLDLELTSNFLSN